jgi:hypothetical protein
MPPVVKLLFNLGVAESADATDLKSVEQNTQSIQQSPLKDMPIENVSPSVSLNPQKDPDLSLVASAWATLSPAIKAGILVMVKAAGNG